MFKTTTKLIKITSNELRRSLASKVDRLKSANFVDIKQCFQLSNELKDKQISLRGWINSTIKSQKNLSFFHLNDGLSNDQIQIVLSKQLENSLKHNLSYGSSIVCTGSLKESKGKQQSIEFKCDQIEFAGENELFPFHNKEHSDDWDNIRQHLHLRFKTKHFASLQRIRSKLLIYLHDYLQSNGYLNITTPLITLNDCEGGGEAFRVVPANQKKEEDKNKQILNESNESNEQDIKEDNGSNDKNEFFGKPTFLTVSGQLHLEAAVLGVNRVYTLSPCFRSEGSVSRKHLCEFQMLELEETYLDSLDILLNRVELLCKNLINHLINECKDEIDFILARDGKLYLDSIINNDYKR